MNTDNNCIPGVHFDKFSEKLNKNLPYDQTINMSEDVVCDGYRAGAQISVFTHFHYDHAWNFKSAMSNSTILLTPITWDAIKALMNLGDRTNIKPTTVGKKYVTPNEDEIELLDANHIPGSVQVLVTSKKTGYKTLYSGDFRYPDIQTQHSDCLIIDGTHGSPDYDFKSKRKDVLEKIFDTVLKSIESDKSVEILSHRGTMQEIMSFLQKSFDDRIIPQDVPFVSLEKEIRLTKALMPHINPNPDVHHELLEMKDATLNDLHEQRKSYILFTRMQDSQQKFVEEFSIQKDRHVKIIIDSYQYFKGKPEFFEAKKGTYRANYSSHSGFSEIIDYVKQVSPEKVIVDGSRALQKTCLRLSQEISRNLNISCHVSEFRNE